MQTAWRTKDWASRRTLEAALDGAGEDYGAIPPGGEALSQEHRDVGLHDAVLRRDAQSRRALAFVDIIAAMGALFAVVHTINPHRVHLDLRLLIVIPFVLLTGKIIGLYDRDQNVLRKTTIDEAPSLFYLAVVYALGVWLGE